MLGGVRQEFRHFEWRIEVSSTTGGSIGTAFRVSTSSTRDPCNRIDSRKATSLHEGATKSPCGSIHGQSKRQTTGGQAARKQQVSMREQSIEVKSKRQPTEITTGKRPPSARGTTTTEGQAARQQQEQGQEARIAQEAQQEEEHGDVESEWRKTGGVMIPAIALVGCRVGCPAV